MANDQICLFADSAEYDAFVEKFRPKKTTDDCYTPPSVYDTVKRWACKEYGIDADKIVRPFFPGGDYQSFDYPEGCAVVDNPPFSILSQILEFYIAHDIKFFLFAPSLTAFSGRKSVMKVNHIICDCSIEYDNGAVVRTSFVTNCGSGIVAQSCPELTNLVNHAVAEIRRQHIKELPRYVYPDHIVTSSMIQRYAKYGVDFKVGPEDCLPISKLDAQELFGKSIFGGGLLLSDRAAADRAAADRAAADRAAADRAAADRVADGGTGMYIWELSARERALVRGMGVERAARRKGQDG